MSKCESCGLSATRSDVEGVPLCDRCYFETAANGLQREVDALRARVAELQAQAGRMRAALIEARAVIKLAVECKDGIDGAQADVTFAHIANAIASSPSGEWEAMQAVVEAARKFERKVHTDNWPKCARWIYEALAALEALRRKGGGT